MCGIAGFHLFEPSDPPMRKYQMENLIDSLLLGIEHRGKDATGVASVMPSGELHIEKADLAASSFIQWRKDLPSAPQSVLLHTRYATQGSPMNLSNNHPIRYGSAVAIHNGHISNDDEIFADESLHRIAQVDSECISALFDKYGIEKAHIPLGKLDGNFAVAVADLRKPGVLVLAKGWSSPLEYYVTKNGIMWASETKIIRDAMQSAFGIEVSFSDIKSLPLGTLLYIEDGEIEQYPFQMYEKPFTYKYNVGWQTPAQKAAWEYEEEDEDVDGFSCLTTFAKMFNKMKGKKGNEMSTSIEAAIGGDIESDEKHVETGDDFAIVHEIVVDQIAENYGATDIFVNWLLFEADDEEVAETPELLNIFIQFQQDYEAFYDLLTGREGSGLNNLSKLTLDAEDAEIYEEEETLDCDCGVAWHDIYEQCEERETECGCENGCWHCKPEPGNPDYDAWFAMAGVGIRAFEEDLSVNGVKTLAALRASV